MTQDTTPRSAPWTDRFGGRLVLVLLDDKFSPSIRNGRSLWGLQRDLRYRTGDAGAMITVPAGFVTDLTSVPRWCWTLIPPDGPWVKAAIIHDFLYATSGTGRWKRRADGRTRPAPYSRREADDIFREALANRGVDAFRRGVLWIAVRLGGAGGWGQDASRQPASAREKALMSERGLADVAVDAGDGML